MGTIMCFVLFRKSYSGKNPIALYRFSFTFKSRLFRPYFIHSHQRIKKAFRALIELRKSSLVIIDQCSEISQCMKVSGRILKDRKKDSDRWDDSRWRALQNIQQNSEKLKRLLAQQFILAHQDVMVEDFQFVRMRETEGCMVYDYDTAVKQFVECKKCR